MTDQVGTVQGEELRQLDALYEHALLCKGDDLDGVVAHSRELVRRAAAAGYAYGHARGLLLDAWVDDLRGDTQAAARKAAEALAIASEAGDEHGVVSALITVGGAERFRGEYQLAREHFARALDVARAAGNNHNLVRAMIPAADLAKLEGDYSRAAELSNEALELALRHGCTDLEGPILTGLGNLHNRLGEYETAVEYHQRAVAASERHSDRHVVAVARFGLATACMRLGQYDQALEQFNRFLEYARAIQSPIHCAYALGNIAIVMNARGRTPTAMRYEYECLKWKEKLGDRSGVAISLNNLGVCHKAIGDYVRAFQAILRSLEICQELGDRAGEAIALDNIGTTYQALGEHARALDCFLRGMRMAQEIGNRTSEAYSLVHIAEHYEMFGDLGRTLLHYMRALRIVEQTNERSLAAVVLQRIGAIHALLKHHDSAEAQLHRSLDIAREIGANAVEIDSLVALADLAMRRSMPHDAIRYLEAALERADSGLLQESRRTVLGALVEACEQAGMPEKRREYARGYSISSVTAFHAVESHRVHELIDRFEDNAIAREGVILGLDRGDVEHVRELIRHRGDGLEPAVTAGSGAVARVGMPAAMGPAAGELDADTFGMYPVRVVTFGALRVTVNGRVLDRARWGRKRARELFKLLLVHHRAWLTVDEIYDRIWTDSTQRNADLLIRNAMSHLRKALAPDRAKDSPGYIHSGDGAYMLDLGDEAWVDFITFKELVVMARRSENALDRARLYTEAVELYHGDFLQEDQFHEWSGYERQVLRDAFLEALEFLARERLRQGDLDAAIETARRILSQDRISETAYEILLLALQRRGRIGEARQALEQCVLAYQQEIASKPSQRLLRLLDDASA